MALTQLGPFQRLWIRWKALKLPWRRQFLAGQDLAGNTFWEFRDAINSQRMRRIVRYNPQTHYADIKISPQWHQWLRQVRGDPPSLQEQAADVQRQENTKVLAAEADERWNKKESLISKPAEKRQRLGSGGIEEQRVTEDEVEHVRQGGSVEGARKERSLENPWAKKGGGPSEGWQPETWTPGVAPRR